MVVSLDKYFRTQGIRDVVLCTYCSRTKDDTYKEGFPEQLYIAKRVKSFFKYAPDKYERAILSYKYGIVPENLAIDNYEQDDFVVESEWWFRTSIKQYRNPLFIVWLPRPCEAVRWENFLNKMKVDWIKITKIKGVDFETLLEGYLTNTRRI